MWVARSRSPRPNHAPSVSHARSSSVARNVSPARPHPLSRSATPASQYVTESRSGETCRPCTTMSSPVLTTTVTSSGGTARTRPPRNFPAPTPPARATTCISGPPNGEQAPLAGDASQRMRPAVLECDAGSGHQVLHRGGDEHLARSGHGRDPRADMDGDAAHPISDQLDLTGVHARPYLHPDPAHRLNDGFGAEDRPSRAIEGRQEPISRRIHLSAPKAGQLSANQDMVPLEEVLPAPVAEPAGAFGRVNDVREQDGG